MPNDNADFDALFAESVTEVEAGGGESGEARSQNARVHLGDGEVIDPQAEDEESEVEEEDEDEVDAPENDEDEDEESETEIKADKAEEFDVTSHKDKLVKVKVDGQEVSVPLSEALNGYMRQADYTRKTQEISGLKAAADWGKQMREAILEDPQGMIEAIAQSAGLQVAPAAEADPYTTDDPELAPVLQELKRTKAEIAELKKGYEADQQAAVLKDVQRESAECAAKYTDYDPIEVLPVAGRHPGMSIEEAYFIVAGRKGGTAKAVETKTATTATAAAKAEKKRRAAEKITSGANRAASGASRPIEGDTFEEMFQFALDGAK